MGLLAARPPRVEKLKRRGDVGALVGAVSYEDDSRDGGASVRASAAAALVDYDIGGVSEALVQALADRDQGVRDAAIATLVARGPKRAVKPMCAAATLWTAPEHAEARDQAVAALEAMHDPEACERVAKSMVVRPADLGDSDRDVIERLTRSAPGSGSRIVDQMVMVLGDGDGGSRAAQMLVWLAPESIDALLGALGEQHKRERAARALGEIHATEAVEPLCGLLLESWDPAVRRVAAWALGEIRDLRAVEALVLATGDAEFEVRTEASGAFDKFGNVGVAIALTAMTPQAALGPGTEAPAIEAEAVKGEEEAAPAIEEPSEAVTETHPVVEAGEPAPVAESPEAEEPAPKAEEVAPVAYGTAAPEAEEPAPETGTEPVAAPEEPATPAPQPTVATNRPPPPTQAVVPALRRLLQRRGEL